MLLYDVYAGCRAKPATTFKQRASAGKQRKSEAEVCNAR